MGHVTSLFLPQINCVCGGKIQPILKPLEKKNKQSRSVSCETQPCTLAANDIALVICVSADSLQGFQSKSVIKPWEEIITWLNY